MSKFNLGSGINVLALFVYQRDKVQSLRCNLFVCYARQLRQAAGLDNLLYTPDADFSCFADLALTSPEDYYLEGQGSLLQ